MCNTAHLEDEIKFLKNANEVLKKQKDLLSAFVGTVSDSANEVNLGSKTSLEILEDLQAKSLEVQAEVAAAGKSPSA